MLCCLEHPDSLLGGYLAAVVAWSLLADALLVAISVGCSFVFSVWLLCHNIVQFVGNHCVDVSFQFLAGSVGRF
jgi:hypothetical protein